MATIAMMVGGAILNDTAFVGGSYLALYIFSRSESDALFEKKDTTKLWRGMKKTTKNITSKDKSF